jgi:Fur family transcriptional regulator, ferric uptake regulator
VSGQVRNGPPVASAAVTDDVDVIASARLRRDGQRYTECRRTLVAVLVEHGPLTIPEILRRRPNLPQSSAYRNLAVLERSGVVRRIITSDEWARYELAEPLAAHHHHLICASCGAVVDFTVSNQLERSLDVALNRVAHDNGFEVEDHRLDLVGRCATCVARNG